MMKNSKYFSLFVIIFLFIACSPEQKKDPIVLKGNVFGTTYKITYLDSDVNYQESIDSLYTEINNSVSTYIPNSDISKINKGDSTIVVDAIFKEVFEKSKEIYFETDGYFDPTVGNLVNAYGFGPENSITEFTDEELAQQMKFVGLDKVELVNGKIKKGYPEIYLDFNSIAKGFALDIVARFLESKKQQNYLIEIGGEIRAKGLKDNGESWLIKLVNPVDVEFGYKKINLSNKSMATSGNYRKFRVADDGTKFVHTVNPLTGKAFESNLLSASVITKTDCADADAYATAFMAMGLEKTKQFLEKNKDVQVILIYFNENNTLQEYSTYKE